VEFAGRTSLPCPRSLKDQKKGKRKLPLTVLETSWAQGICSSDNEERALVVVTVNTKSHFLAPGCRILSGSRSRPRIIAWVTVVVRLWRLL
jgi:hypothetical protein